MRLIDYLKEKFLNELGFSEDTFILPDPCGIPMGGSGICARPVDMLKIIYLISKDGVYNDKQLIPADYIKAARMKQSDPYGKSGTLEEMQGYGYQIWITRNGGYALYGMAGQLALYVPDKDIYMVTTADTLDVKAAYSAYMMPSGKKSIIKSMTKHLLITKLMHSLQNTIPLLTAVNCSALRTALLPHMRI